MQGILCCATNHIEAKSELASSSKKLLPPPNPPKKRRTIGTNEQGKKNGEQHKES
jgi:hypothetical protein